MIITEQNIALELGYGVLTILGGFIAWMVLMTLGATVYWWKENGFFHSQKVCFAIFGTMVASLLVHRPNMGQLATYAVMFYGLVLLWNKEG